MNRPLKAYTIGIAVALLFSVWPFVHVNALCGLGIMLAAALALYLQGKSHEPTAAEARMTGLVIGIGTTVVALLLNIVFLMMGSTMATDAIPNYIYQFFSSIFEGVQGITTSDGGVVYEAPSLAVRFFSNLLLNTLSALIGAALAQFFFFKKRPAPPPLTTNPQGQTRVLDPEARQALMQNPPSPLPRRPPPPEPPAWE